jgi:hypothetical protein
MQRKLLFAFFAVYALISSSANPAAETDPALRAAESFYRQEGAEAALPKFEALAAQFKNKDDDLNYAKARPFVGVCHWRLGNFNESRVHLNAAFAMR